jgi:putative selenium metabolism hydrolase
MDVIHPHTERKRGGFMLSRSIQEEVVAFAQEIIHINSLSGEEGAVADAIQDKMRSLEYDEIKVDPYGSVIAQRQGDKPGPRILFDAHMDVVPVPDPQDWRYDPFGGEIHEDKIWGRGASDMKGPLAAAVVSLGHIPRQDFQGTIIVSTSVHEEKHEGAALQRVMEISHPDFVVICEPNGSTLGIGQKGRAGMTIDVRGKPAHSSVPHLGDNAIYKAVDIITRLRQMPLPSNDLLGKGIMEIIDGVSRPYPSRSTVPVGFFMHYDRRLMQGETQESVLQSVRTVVADIPDCEVEFQQIELDTYTNKKLVEVDFHPGWVIEKDSPLVMKAHKGLAGAGIAPEYSTAQFCTNGSYSAGIANIPTIIFGPSSGLLAHCQDEYIAISELLEGAAGYMGLARELGK